MHSFLELGKKCLKIFDEIPSTIKFKLTRISNMLIK